MADEDEALVAAAVAGSAAAWEKLVRRYENRIYNYGLRLTGQPSDAMDLMQEVFLGVYRNLHRFRGDARFSSWIFRIAHNKAVDLNRRKALLQGSTYTYNDEGEEQELRLPASEDSEPDQLLSQLENNQQIKNLLAELPLDQRLVVELKTFQSLTFEEIAKTQEISENTAKTRFYSALRKMKQILEDTHVLS